jgi:hypothetical protein
MVNDEINNCFGRNHRLRSVDLGGLSAVADCATRYGGDGRGE